jgi:nicotinate phosphoribosyltransferase
MSRDIVSVENDRQSGEPLLQLVMSGGRRIARPPSLTDIRALAACQLERLPDPLRRLETGAQYSVEVADALTQLAAEVDRRLAQSKWMQA